MAHTINLIKRRRHEKGMFQRTLAKRMKVSEKTIQRWEKYETYPSVMQMNKLERVLGVSITKLMKNMIDCKKEKENIK